jgi:hypothetical protein
MTHTNKINRIHGILLIYHHPISKDASTIYEHIHAFEAHSSFKVWIINTELGFPHALKNFSFDIYILHYSLFGSYPFKFDCEIISYIKNQHSSLKIGIFQDEYQFCKERFSYINELDIDMIYTLVEPPFFYDTYLKYTNAKEIISCIPGYVSEKLKKASYEFYKQDNSRTIDIGYRGRQLPAYMGKEAFEKTDIAKKFLEHSKKINLTLNIDTRESSRLYGKDWYGFLSNCKGVIGVEAGVSIFDLDGQVYNAYQNILESNGNVTYESLSEYIDLANYEGKIPYRCISPRHFEAAALKVCQILYEGEYSGILKPMIHYIPLKKDFSNFEEVILFFNNPQIRHNITENAYKDLIESGNYTYQKFIEDFDQRLINNGFIPNTLNVDSVDVMKLIRKDYYKRIIIRSRSISLQLIGDFFRKCNKIYPHSYKKFESIFNIYKKIKQKFPSF